MMKLFKAKPIVTEVGEILPALQNDKLRDGTAINTGSLFMQMNGGTATFTHKDKEVVVRIGSSLNGATILTAPSGRMFVVKLQSLIEHAIKHGLLDSELRFEQQKEKK